MERDHESDQELIELGSITQATKGGWGHYTDEFLTQNMPGLSWD